MAKGMMFREILTEDDRKQIRKSRYKEDIKRLKKKAKRIMGEENILVVPKKNTNNALKVKEALGRSGMAFQSGMRKMQRGMGEIQRQREELSKEFKKFQSEGRDMFGSNDSGLEGFGMEEKPKKKKKNQKSEWTQELEDLVP